MFWAGAAGTVFRFDIVNTRRGDTGTEAIIRNADGTRTMYMVRLKVQNGAITEIETIKANKGDADRLWDDRIASRKFRPPSSCRFASPSATPTTT